MAAAPLELPRHDCNAFDHGRASYGSQRAADNVTISQSAS
jgi:hypothetical protein